MPWRIRAEGGFQEAVRRCKKNNFKTKENIMFKLKSTLATYLALAMIRGIVAYS